MIIVLGKDDEDLLCIMFKILFVVLFIKLLDILRFLISIILVFLYNIREYGNFLIICKMLKFFIIFGILLIDEILIFFLVCLFNICVLWWLILFFVVKMCRVLWG